MRSCRDRGDENAQESRRLFWSNTVTLSVGPPVRTCLKVCYSFARTGVLTKYASRATSRQTELKQIQKLNQETLPVASTNSALGLHYNL